MKIKGWAVWSGCCVNGPGNSRVHRSTWNTLSSPKYFMRGTCCMVLNELCGDKEEKKLWFLMQSFSKEMLIQTLAHRGEAHIPCRFLRLFFYIFFLCCVAIATAHFQGEYFSPGGKQTQVRAGSRGQWCFFKETLSLFFSFFSLSTPSVLNSGILTSADRAGEMTGTSGDAWVRRSGSALKRLALTPSH